MNRRSRNTTISEKSVCVSQAQANELLAKSTDPQLIKFIQRFVKDTQQAKDIQQEVIIKMLRQQAALKEKPRAWMFKVARNASLNYLRSVKRQEERLEKIILANAATEGNNYNDLVVACLLKLVPTLKPKYRQAIELVVLEGISQKEMAERLGLSLTGGKSRIQRARKLLLQRFLEYCEIEQDSYGNIISCVNRSCAYTR